MKKILIVGGGAAGMMAAVRAAGADRQVTILEKMKSWAKSCISQARVGVI